MPFWNMKWEKRILRRNHTVQVHNLSRALIFSDTAKLEPGNLQVTVNDLILNVLIRALKSVSQNPLNHWML